MDKLINKKYANYNYTSRYISVPYYYDTEAKRYVYGIGEQFNRDSTSYVSHKVVQGDTLDSLALKYFNDPTTWWIIAYFNRINDPFINLQEKFTIINIPSATNVEFKDPR